jgi:ATP synthase protein I
MNDEPIRKPRKDRGSLPELVGAKAKRKLKARRNSAQGVWFGLGMMGLIGWSVAIPTLLGAALGLWLWHWVSKEDKAMRDEEDDDNE